MGEEGSISEPDYNQIQSFLSQAVRNPREDLQGVFIYRRDGQIFSNTTYSAYINYNYDFKNSEWYRQAIAAKGKAVFTGKVNDSRVYNRPQPAFSVFRAIKVYNGPILGVLIIDVNFTGLESIFKNVNLGSNSNIVVLDAQNNIIYSKNKNYLSVLPKVNTSSHTIQYLKADNNELTVNLVDSTNTGWKIVGIASSSEMNHEKTILYQTILMVSAILFVVIVVISVLLSDTLAKPLTILRQLMRKVENGDFNVSYQLLKGSVEISYVGRAFNAMSQKIDELINQVLEIRFKKQEAELNSLKLQIRPHFLYNNLEAIRALAEIDDKKGILDITSALGGMLRYSLSKQDAKVRIQDEIHQIHNYLKIEQIRSGHSLRIEYDLDQALLNCCAIPILLLPVVENCIHHGFDQISGDKHIHILMKPCSEGIFIQIRDNGAGMKPEELDKLNAYLGDVIQQLDFADSGIGLKNLASRIQLEYGASYGISLRSKYQEGMTVQIRIPRVEFEAMK
jgi:two-component system sensor histidine kinase YesM